MKRLLTLPFALLLLCSLVPAQASASVTAVSCPFSDIHSGDRFDRGFYVTGYPAGNIDTVTLANGATTPGVYTLTLTARSGTYDGPVVGTSTIMVTIPDSEIRVTFPFGGVPVVRGSIITFALDASGPDTFSYDTGVGPCPGVVQTDGTDPPLSTVRRDSVGLTITRIPSSDFTYSVAGRQLIVSVTDPGTVTLSDAAGKPSASAAKKRKQSLLLKPSTASGNPPTISVALTLSKAAKKKLRQKGKVSVKANITFTPTGGSAKTQTAKLTIRGKKKR